MEYASNNSSEISRYSNQYKLLDTKTDDALPLITPTSTVKVVSKRKDIQWLRALAISTVFTFHLLPHYCPQGYLGVDVFFVISGYLMTRILYNSKKLSFVESTITFYNKRMKRLFPPYFLIILLTVIMGKYILLDSDYMFLIQDAKWSSFFISNIPPIFETHGYFDMTNEFKFLLHTWSLSVEVQYYLIAPLLCFILHRTYRLHYTSLIILSSLLLQWILRGTTMEFDLLFCRLWQFLVGTMAFLLSENHKFELEKSSDKRHRNLFCGAALLLIFLCTMPQLSTSIDYKFSVRLFATVLSGVIVYAGHYTQLQLPVSVDAFLTYLGDISYGLYLVHWPIILFGRYMTIDSKMFGHIFIILASIVAAILLYELFDKLILIENTFTVFVRTGIIFGIILILCFNSSLLNFNDVQQESELSKDLGGNLSLENVIRINQEFDASCRFLPIKNCRNDSTLYSIFEKYEVTKSWIHNCVVDFNKKGTKVVALLGNSFSARFTFTAAQVLNMFPSVKKLYFISRPACTIFDTLLRIEQPKWHCEEKIGKNMAFVKKIRPDIIIHVSRYNHIAELNDPIYGTDCLQNNSIVLGIKNEIAEYEKYTNKIIFLQPSLVPLNSNFQGPKQIARLLKFNNTLSSLDSFALPRKEAEENMNPSWIRIQAGISDCKKCIVVPTLDLFCDQTKCPVAEPSGLSRYCDTVHLSEIGSNLMLSRLKNVLNTIL